MSHTLPPLDRFCGKFCHAVRESGAEDAFLAKWGLSDLEEVERLLRDNVQGGYDSYAHSIRAAPPVASVLSIGPGMGFCEFLLAETHDRVVVSEPDADNCDLLSRIAAGYETERGDSGDSILRFLPAGLSLTEEALRYWEEKQKLMAARGRGGSILNFDVRSSVELESVLERRVERIFLHKVLSSLSVATSLDEVLARVARFVEPGGVLTWSEPGYVFSDTLGLDDFRQFECVVVTLVESSDWECSVSDYTVSSQVADGQFDDPWLLLRLTRRSSDATAGSSIESSERSRAG